MQSGHCGANTPSPTTSTQRHSAATSRLQNRKTKRKRKKIASGSKRYQSSDSGRLKRKRLQNQEVKLTQPLQPLSTSAELAIVLASFSKPGLGTLSDRLNPDHPKFDADFKIKVLVLRETGQRYTTPHTQVQPDRT